MNRNQDHTLFIGLPLIEATKDIPIRQNAKPADEELARFTNDEIIIDKIESGVNFPQPASAIATQPRTIKKQLKPSKKKE